MDLSTTPNQLLHFPHQEMGSRSDSQSLDSMIPTMSQSQSQNQKQEQREEQKKPRPPDGEPQKCPRCDSANTKFCYYNNYSLTQPRYFCKACRRYWTKGGTLRNVPVGGGCRKSSKRSSSSTSPSLSPSHFLKRPHNRDPLVPALANPLFPGLNSYNHHPLLGLGFEGVDQDQALPMSQRALFGHYDGMSFLQELQYGNGNGNGGGGLMFQNLCGYDESNCVSGISEDMAAASMAPYEEVKQERAENGALWGHQWQMMNGQNVSLMGGGGGDVEALRENNWSGLIGNPAWGLLNTPALM